MTVTDWLSGAKDAGIEVLSCTDLETIRENYFVESADLIKPQALASAATYQAAADDALKRLDAAQAALKAKLDADATLDALLIAWRVVKFEFGKSGTLIGCMAPDVTASKLFCAVGIVSLIDDAISVANGSVAKTELSKRAKELMKKTDELKARYAELKKNAAKFDMPAAAKQRTTTFQAMCTAVQKQCLAARPQ